MDSKRASGVLGRCSVVVIYAAAMAWVESAVVFYLRTMIDRIVPYQEMPLPLVGGIGGTELVRELATMVMLVTIGWLAGSTTRTRIAYSAIAFGVWDILYYAFLKIMCDWPASIFDWDILFLIPLPWWGPVIAPILIAALMIIWGSMVVFARDESSVRTSWVLWSGCGAGMTLGLYVFMLDALKVAGGGSEAMRRLLPVSFNWPLFGMALMLMSLPVIGMLCNNWGRRSEPIRG